MAHTKKAMTKRIVSVMLTLMMTLIFLPQVPQLKANAVVEYSLYVFDKRVTSANCNDILGNGSARYSPSNKTLYLTERITDYEHAHYKDFKSVLPSIRSFVKGLTINVSGQVWGTGVIPFDRYDYQFLGIELYEDTTITGDGKLYFHGDRSIDVYDNSILTIRDVTVSINSSGSIRNYAMGICGNGDNTKLIIDHANVYVKSDPNNNTAAISGFKRGIELSNICRINKYNTQYSTGSLYDGYAIVKSDGSFYKTTNICAIDYKSVNELKTELGNILDYYISGAYPESVAVNDIMVYDHNIRDGSIFVYSLRILVNGKFEYIKVKPVETGSHLRIPEAKILKLPVNEADIIAVLHDYSNGTITRTEAINKLYNYLI